jgi:thymidine kinase
MNFYHTRSYQKENFQNLENSLFQNIKKNKKFSQMHKLLNKDSVDVAIVDKNAYWVHNNTFYVAEINDLGEIDTDNAKKIDVFSLSNKEAKNLLKILDSLTERN